MSTVFTRRTVPAGVAAAAAVAIVLCLSLVGCQPEPGPSPVGECERGPSSRAHRHPLQRQPSPTPSETAGAGEEIALPAACEELYSAAMLASLQRRAPLNDPGVTMNSTQNVGALEILTPASRRSAARGAPRASPGSPRTCRSSTPAQSAAVSDALRSAGFACEPIEGGTVCRTEQTVITQDDEQVTLSETHFLRGNGWISTATINFEPEGYTEDIVSTLWG